MNIVLYLGKNVFKQAGTTTPDYITASVPFFFLLMLVDAIVGYGKTSRGGKYALPDSISSITSGSLQVVFDTLILRPFLGVVPYAYIYQNYAIYRVDTDSWLVVCMSNICISFKFHIVVGNFHLYRFLLLLVPSKCP